jgi:hypothetical protein
MPDVVGEATLVPKTVEPGALVLAVANAETAPLPARVLKVTALKVGVFATGVMLVDPYALFPVANASTTVAVPVTTRLSSVFNVSAALRYRFVSRADPVPH